MYYSARHLYESFVNFRVLLPVLLAGRSLVGAYAYAIRAGIVEQEAFFEALRYSGFEVKVKDLQVFPGGIKKGNWDVGMTVDVLRLAPEIDIAVVVSGDGDFADLIEELKRRGLRVEVAAFGRTCATRLKELADDFIDLEGEERILIKRIPKEEIREPPKRKAQ